MDAITLTAITSAIAAGAAASAKDLASAAVKDAYSGLKALVVRKYASVDLAPVERMPESANKRGSLEEDLAKAGAGDDTELRALARALADALAKDAPEAAPAIGLHLRDWESDSLRIGAVEVAKGIGVVIEGARMRGAARVGDVRVGTPQPGKEERDGADPR